VERNVERNNEMPFVTIKSGFLKPDGAEEVLREYVCDWPNCPNIGLYPLGVITEIRAFAVVCEEHKAQIHGKKRPTTS
jgi:hypothetical protein